jgi:hypothetical protein
MVTDAQVRANQANAQHSTGPTSDTGKAASSKNHFTHGLTGHSFTVLDFEDQDEFDSVLCGLRFEHQPATMTEAILVEKMAQSYWLSKRALYLQAHRAFGARCARSNEDQCATDPELTLDEQQKQLALLIRYQTTHDRAFHRSLNDLLKLRAEKRKIQIGFESQERQRNEESRKAAQESRREAAEKRKQELHKWDLLHAEAKVTHQQVLTSNLELDRTLAEIANNQRKEAKQAA